MTFTILKPLKKQTQGQRKVTLRNKFATGCLPRDGLRLPNLSGRVPKRTPYVIEIWHCSFPIPPGPARRFSTGLRSGLSNGRFHRAIKNSSFAMSVACFGSLSYRNTHTKELLSSTNGTVLEKTFKHSQRSTFSVFSPPGTNTRRVSQTIPLPPPLSRQWYPVPILGRHIQRNKTELALLHLGRIFFLARIIVALSRKYQHRFSSVPTISSDFYSLGFEINHDRRVVS
jgi:hypothetical protein